MNRRVSSSLEIRDAEGGRRISCVKCGHGVAPAGEAWKPGAALVEAPMKAAPDAPYCGGEHVLLRRFCCPGCGALLDSEIALAGEAFLNDILFE